MSLAAISRRSTRSRCRWKLQTKSIVACWNYWQVSMCKRTRIAVLLTSIVLRHLICFIDAEPGEAAARRPECARAHSRRRRYGRMAQIAAMHESASGPSVWTGRALQAESDDLEVVGLALLYPALD